MISLDSNVLIRLLVEDDQVQAGLARRLIESAQEGGERCFIGDPVLCEIEWVLDSAYGASRRDIGTALQYIVTSPSFVFDDRAAVESALDRYCRGKADFSDYLLGTRAQKKGAGTTYTFDKALRDEEGFTLLS
jgi:predicted nucleic-acid-binding protein